MKKLFTLLFLGVFASCGEKGTSENQQSSNILEDFSFSIDTISFDVGDAVFNPLAYRSHDLSADGKTLYFYYGPAKEMHEYDLVQRKLLARHAFESDGPNAVPSYFNSFQALPGEEFFIADFGRVGIYGLDGSRLQTVRVQAEDVGGLDLDASFPLTKNSVISSDKRTLISLPKRYGAPDAGLAVINLEQMTGKILNLPALDMTKNYQVIYEEGMMQSGDLISLQYLRDQVIIYSGATSDSYTYDWKTDSLQLRIFPHQLVAASKVGEFPPKVNTEERLMEVSKEIQKQITFGKFYWDETRKLYFRIGNTNEDYARVSLFAYTADFALIGETLLPDLYYLPDLEFFHEGKLYSYYPVGDEPTWLVFTFDF